MAQTASRLRQMAGLLGILPGYLLAPWVDWHWEDFHNIKSDRMESGGLTGSRWPSHGILLLLEDSRQPARHGNESFILRLVAAACVVKRWHLHHTGDGGRV